MNEWTVVFELELSGGLLKRAVGVSADRELSDTELEQHARACLPWRERGEYRLLKIRREPALSEPVAQEMLL